jgi:hypothetical protein
MVNQVWHPSNAGSIGWKIMVQTKSKRRCGHRSNGRVPSKHETLNSNPSTVLTKKMTFLHPRVEIPSQ